MRQQPSAPTRRPTNDAVRALAEDLSEEVGVGHGVEQLLSKDG